MTYKICWNHDGCIIDISDTLNFKKFERIDNDLYSNDKFDDIKYFIRDLTGVKLFEISKDELEIEAFLNFAVSSYKSRFKEAFIINNKKIEDYMKFYIQTSINLGNPWEQKIFSNHDDALTWVSN